MAAVPPSEPAYAPEALLVDSKTISFVTVTSAEYAPGGSVSAVFDVRRCVLLPCCVAPFPPVCAVLRPFPPIFSWPRRVRPPHNPLLKVPRRRSAHRRLWGLGQHTALLSPHQAGGWVGAASPLHGADAVIGTPANTPRVCEGTSVSNDCCVYVYVYVGMC